MFLKQKQSRPAVRVGPGATVLKSDTQKDLKTGCTTFRSCPLVCICADSLTAILGIGSQKVLTAVE
jgi:hypothetical protein